MMNRQASIISARGRSSIRGGIKSTIPLDGTGIFIDFDLSKGMQNMGDDPVYKHDQVEEIGEIKIEQ